MDNISSIVTLVSDDDDNLTTHKYNLYTGAIRKPYIREEKSGCINLIFSDGAYKEVVLKSLVELRNGSRFFMIGKEEVECVTFNPRKELSGKHVDTKIEFNVSGEKLVIHAYNSTQKLTIQG